MSNILLYSKFSPCCEKLFELVGTVPEFLQYFRIIPICIDNKNIRDKILQERKIMVNYVPTLLLMVGDGVIEKYEGEYVFEWIREKINPKKNEDIPVDKNIQPIQNIQKNVNTRAPKKPTPFPKKTTTPKGTSILDIPEEPEENSEENIDDIIEEIEEEEAPPVKSPNGKINVQAAMAQAEAHRLKLEEEIQGNRKRPNVVRR